MKKTSILIILMAVFAFLSGALTVAFLCQRHRIARQEHVLGSIPLRNDQRRQTVQRYEGEMHQVSFYSDSTILFVSGNTLFLQNVRDTGSRIVFKGHTETIQDYEVSPDRKHVVSSSEDGTLRLWNVHTGECIAVSQQIDTLEQPSWTMLHDIVYSRNGKEIMSADMTGIKIWRAIDLKLLSSENSDIFYLCNGVLSPDWKTFCSRIPDLLEGFNIYERKTKDEEYLLLDHLGDRDPLCYSADGKRLIVVQRDSGNMEVLSIKPKTMRETRSWLWFYSPKAYLYDAAFSQDGKQLVSAHGDGTVRIWNAENGAEREVLHWEGHEIDGVCFSPDGVRVLAYSNHTGEYCIWGPFSWMI